ncbi:MAG: hypothetical protein ABEK00_01495 [Candidatus Nanohaloarchaea archaeon]
MDTTEDGEYIEGEVVRPYDGEDEEYGEEYEVDVENVELPEEVNTAIETMPHGESHAR